jgi:ABC-type nickel/cobalt efflux system permease component RcnA
MMLGAISGWLVGLLIGMRHALEPDHLAAISTIVTEHRESRFGLVLGAAWGIGHTATLVVAGGVLLALRTKMPPNLEASFELGVALMLIGLGGRAIWQAVREGRRIHSHSHHHGSAACAHTGGADHVHIRRWTLARRPLLIGLMHGLAGSGALTAAVLAAMPTLRDAVVYMVLFGLGSAVGMALLTGLTGKALSHLAQHRRATPLLLGCSGVLSLGLGVVWAVKHASALLV